MRPPVTAAALCAAFLSFLPSARAQDVPEPDAHTVLEPPTEQVPPVDEQRVPPPWSEPAAPAPRVARGDLGFQLRAGAAETDRFTFGSSLAAGSGPVVFGLSGDLTADVHGSGRHHGDGDGGDSWSDWCRVRSDGRCLNRVDVSFSGFGGFRHRSDPILGGSSLRLELVGELGWQLSTVDERIETSGGTYWSEANRAYPFAGVRGGVGLTFLRNGYFGVGGFARQGLAGKVCVTTDGGCTRVGGMMGGVYLFGGAEWGIGR